jgi:protein-S-isoprenylcysteine O-methyltransferase Ste14
MPSSSFLKTIHRWRSRAGFFGLVLVLILSRPSLVSLLLGLGICLVGLFIRTWASGHLIKEKKLIVSGPYQYTRNPLYFANLIIGISVVVTSLSWFVLIIFMVYFLLFYPLAVKREKGKMKNLFPEDYKEYEKKVPLFFPSLKSHRPGEKRQFDWGLYKKNKEYRALLGAVLFWMLMAGRLILF